MSHQCQGWGVGKFLDYRYYKPFQPKLLLMECLIAMLTRGRIFYSSKSRKVKLRNVCEITQKLSHRCIFLWFRITNDANILLLENVYE